jgi:hypothetical protein
MADYSAMSDAELLKLVGGQTSSNKVDYSAMSDDDLLKSINQPSQLPIPLAVSHGQQTPSPVIDTYKELKSSVNDYNPIDVLGPKAGKVLSYPVELAVDAYKGLVPQKAQDAISDFAGAAFADETPVGGALSSAAKGVGKAYQTAKENYPDIVTGAENIANIAAIAPIAGSVLKLAGKGVSQLAKAGSIETTTKSISKMPTGYKTNLVNIYDKKIADTVAEDMSGMIGNKAKSSPQFKAENAKRVQAVESIIKDPAVNFVDDAGKTHNVPRNTQEWAEAIDMRKRNIYNSEQAQMLKQSGDPRLGAVIPVDGSIAEVQKIVDNRALWGKPIHQQAIKELEILNKIKETTGGYTINEAHEIVTNANANLKTYLRKVNPELDSSLALSNNIAQDLRKGLDDKIMSITGDSFSKAQQEYGALLSVEEDINKLRNKAAKLNSDKSNISYMDMATDWSALHGGLQMVGSASSAGAANVVSAGIMKGWNAAMNYMTHPDRITGKMFKKVEKLSNRRDMVSGTIPKPTISGEIGYEVRMGGEGGSLSKGIPPSEYPKKAVAGQIEYKPSGGNPEPSSKIPIYPEGKRYSTSTATGLIEQPLPDNTSAMNPKGIGLKKRYPEPKPKDITPDIAKSILKEAKGNKDLAREMAKKRGYIL